jgi:biopolymer transport protein ExbD
MVDLGFLLITFFIFTSTMAEKKAMKLYMPSDKGTSSAPESKVVTVLLASNNKVYTYEGKFEDALKENKVIPTTYNLSSGIGQVIRNKQKRLQAFNKNEGRNDLIYLIKPTKQSTYSNIVDALDEATINDVKKYMVVEPSPEETSYCSKF